MNRVIIALILGMVLGGAAVWRLRQGAEGGHAGAAEAKSGEAAQGREANEDRESGEEGSRVRHRTNGTVFLQLDAATQGRMGLVSTSLAALKLPREAEAHGLVLDPAPLLAYLAEADAVRVSLTASVREFDRLAAMAKSGNASVRSVEVAEAAMKKDQVAYDALRPRFQSAWGQALAGSPDLVELARAFSRQEAVLVRVDLPWSQVPDGAPQAARIAPLAAPERSFDAALLGPAPASDPQFQGRGFFLVVKTNALPVHAAVVARLLLPGEPEAGLLVPDAAVVRNDGGSYVYLQTSPEAFERREISISRRTPDGAFVTAGLGAGARVVTVGAQQLLSEELKGHGGGE